MRRGGRGRTHAGLVVNLFLLESLKRVTIMQTLKKFEYKQGVAREGELFKKLRKEGMTDQDIKKHMRELIREGEVFCPRPEFYRRTAYRPHKRRKK